MEGGGTRGGAQPSASCPAGRHGCGPGASAAAPASRCCRRAKAPAARRLQLLPATNRTVHRASPSPPVRLSAAAYVTLSSCRVSSAMRPLEGSASRSVSRASSCAGLTTAGAAGRGVGRRLGGGGRRRSGGARPGCAAIAPFARAHWRCCRCCSGCRSAAGAGGRLAAWPLLSRAAAERCGRAAAPWVPQPRRRHWSRAAGSPGAA